MLRLISPQTAAAERRPTGRVVDGDDRPEAGLSVLDKDDPLVIVKILVPENRQSTLPLSLLPAVYDSFAAVA